MSAANRETTTSPPSPDAWKEPLAIVGIGCLFPGADSLDAYWGNIRAGVDSITEVPPSHWSAKDYFAADPSAPDMTYARRGGFLEAYPFDPLRYGISPNNLEATDATQLLGLVVAEQALRDAGYATGRDADDGRQFDRDRTSVILGVTGTLQLVIPLGARLGHPLWRKALAEAGVAKDVADDVVQRISDGYVPWQENSFPGLLGNVAAGRIANRFDLGGTNCVVDAACASSLSALHMAAMELHAGRADMVLTGGFDTFNDIFMYMCFSKTPALSASGDSRPFSADGDGTILGEGLGMVVLKRLADAKRDGDRIYAVVRGIGSSSDGRGNAIYAPSATGQMKALRSAYRAADVSPKTIELVEAHGTGTKVGDLTETTSLAEVFRQDGGEGTWCAVGSVKSMIGHTKAAAGVAGLIKAAMALNDKVLPPTLKIKEPLEPLLPGNSPGYANTVARPWVAPADHPRRAALSAFGFGGSNFHCVLEEVETTRNVVRWDGRVQILAFSAASPAELEAQLAAFDAAASWKALRKAAAHSRARFDADKLHRMAIVVERDRTDIAKVVGNARQKLTATRGPLDGRPVHWSTNDGTFFGSGIRTDKLAVLFPGQGSQYVNMQRELACQFPAMLTAIDVVNSAFGRREPGERLSDYLYPPPVFSESDRTAQEERLRNTEIAQPALSAVSFGIWRVLESFGVKAREFAGHSFGELVALCAAGRIPDDDLARLAVERGRAMSAAAAGRGAMLAVVAPVETVRNALVAAKLMLTLANHNGPSQVVLSGDAQEIDRAADWFGKQGIRTVKLPVSAAFHSPLVADAEAAFARAVSKVVIGHGPRVFSNTTGGEYPREASGASQLLSGQLARPVEFVREIEAMYAIGVRTFLEVGPQAKLSGLVRSILGDRPHITVAVDASSGRRSGQFDFACALAELAVLGEVRELKNWDPQPEETKPKKKPGLIVPLSGVNYVKPREGRGVRDTGRGKDAGCGIRDSGNAQTTKMPSPPVSSVQAPLACATLPASSPNPESRIPNSIPVPKPAIRTPRPQFPAPSPQPPISSPASSMELDHALRLNEQSILALERMQEQTAQLHRQYLEGQLIAQRTVEQLVEQQQWLLEGGLARDSGSGIRDSGMAAPREIGDRSQEVSATQRGYTSPPVPPPQPPVMRSPVVSQPARPAAVASARPVTPPVRAATPVSVPTASAASLPAASVPAVFKESAVTLPDFAATLLEIVADKTGYPVETLDLDMSLDADLGIDSIKRVEIMSAVQERLPDAPAVRPDDLGRLQTLRQIVDFLAASATPKVSMPSTQLPQPTSSPSVSSASSVVNNSAVRNNSAAAAPEFEQTLLEVVADKTGYPVETLELDMSLDADLGIDSIKRVEILSALQERMPDAPPVKPDDLGRLQTLRQIVAFLDAGSAANGVSANPILPAAPFNGAALPVRSEEPATVPAEHVADAGVESTRESGELTRRVLKTVSPPANRAEIALDRAAEFWIAGEGDLAEALRRELIARRIVARVVPFDAVLGNRPVCGLCILSPGEERSARKNRRNDSVAASTNHGRFIAEAFQVLQRVGPGLRETGRTSAAVLATVSRLGGTFALEKGGTNDPIGGALAGLTKTAALEWPEVHAKAIDVDDSLATDLLARQIADELLTAGPVEVGIGAGGAIALEPVDEAQSSPSQQPLGEGDVVVVSGGARGVAAEAAVALAAKFAATLLLLGRSPEPTPEPEWATGLVTDVEIKRAIVAAHDGPIAPKVVEFQCRRLLASREIERTIARIEAAGGRATYRSVDVRDAAALRPVLVDARKHLGPIRGVVHAAGVLADRLIEDKTNEQFAEVWSTKVDGALALLEATRDDELSALAFFSSSTARYGRKGQIDYAAANEALNKLAQREARRRKSCRVVSINWGPWDGGMVTPGLKKLFAAEGVGVIRLESGATFLADELAAAPGGPVEIVVLGPRPEGSDASGSAPSVRAIAAQASPRAEVKSTATMHQAFERELSVETCPVLRSHVINGRAVLPMALMVEWLAHAALHDNPGLEFVGLDDLRVFKGVILEPDGHVMLRALASSPEAHESQETVQVELHSGNTLHARARVVLGSSLGEGAPTLSIRGGQGLADANVYDGVRLFHGEQLHGITHVESCGPEGIVAESHVSPRPSDWIAEPLRNRWLADPLALDAAFQLMIVWCFEQRGIGSLPTRFARYRQFARAFPPGGVRTKIRVDRQGPHNAEATIEFCDAAGKLVARIDGYECVLDASLREAFARNELPAEVG